MQGNIFLWPFNQSLIKHNLTLVTPNPLPSPFIFPIHRFSDPQFPLRRVNRPPSIYFVNVFFSKQASLLLFLLFLLSPLPSALPHFLEGASAPSFDRVSAIFFPFRFSKELQASTYGPLLPLSRFHIPRPLHLPLSNLPLPIFGFPFFYSRSLAAPSLSLAPSFSPFPFCAPFVSRATTIYEVRNSRGLRKRRKPGGDKWSFCVYAGEEGGISCSVINAEFYSGRYYRGI